VDNRRVLLNREALGETRGTQRFLAREDILDFGKRTHSTYYGKVVLREKVAPGIRI
jgi:hypothetical protein